MRIGTASASDFELKKAKHHMLSFVDPLCDYNAALFQSHARDVIIDIFSRGKTPILCGGTGLYVKALLYDIDFSSTGSDEIYRNILENILDEKGSQYLYNMLMKIDKISADEIHPNNTKRVIRALEIHHISGLTKSSQSKKDKLYYDRSCIIGIKHERDALYKRINERVLSIINDGLEQEVFNLINMGCTIENNCMQAIGYKEYLLYLNEMLSKDDCIDKIKQNSRKYAKRQMTWFNKMDVKWFDYNDIILHKYINIYKYIFNNYYVL